MFFFSKVRHCCLQTCEVEFGHFSFTVNDCIFLFDVPPKDHELKALSPGWCFGEMLGTLEVWASWEVSWLLRHEGDWETLASFSYLLRPPSVSYFTTLSLVLGLTTGPGTAGPSIVGWNPHNRETKWTFPPLKLIVPGSCRSNWYTSTVFMGNLCRSNTHACTIPGFFDSGRCVEPTA